MAESTTFFVPALMGEPGEPKAWFTIHTSLGQILLIFQGGSVQHREFTKIAETMLEGTGERLGALGLDCNSFEEAVAHLMKADPTLQGTNLLQGDGPEAREVMEAMKSTDWLGLGKEDPK
jgi:hypothetical protein